MLKLPRIAIVSDPLVQRGGAERVVEAMALAFPDAPIFAVLYSPKHGPASLAARIRTSWLQKVPGASAKHRSFLPLFPFSIESFDLAAFDVILSSHHTVAKGLLRGAEQLHICYCHTPMRALWERSSAELRTVPAMTRPLASLLFGFLRVWDYAAAGRVDMFIANSRLTQERIQRHYGRDSVLLQPPIEVDRFTPAARTSNVKPYYLIASRPVPYKRVAVAAAAAVAMNRRVIIAGGFHKDVPTHPHVEQVGVVDDCELIQLMRGATALLYPQHEDFGMTALEMNACGRPTIAFASGGALETILDGETGVLVESQTADAFARGIARLEALSFDPLTLRKHALKFSRAAFVADLRRLVEDAWARHSSRI